MQKDLAFWNSTLNKMVFRITGKVTNHRAPFSHGGHEQSDGSTWQPYLGRDDEHGTVHQVQTEHGLVQRKQRLFEQIFQRI